MQFLKISAFLAVNLLSIPATLAAPTNGTVSSFTCNPGYPVSAAEQSVIFTNFLRKFYIEKNVEQAVYQHIAVVDINHNPNVPSGRENGLNFIRPLINTWNVTIVNSGFADNVGWSHVKVEGPNLGRYIVAVDVWRFEGSCMVEHWDVIQNAPPLNRTNPLELA